MRQIGIPGIAGSMLDKLIVDMFCCAGGASQGLERGLGRSPDIAGNHDAAAIHYHELNHPATEHLLADVWEVDPRKACRGRRVGWAHFSPDCTYFSRAKGSKPLRDAERKIRALAWNVVKWAALVRPDVISLENVPEFLEWCNVRRGKPVKKLLGRYFRMFVEQLRSLGYQVEWKTLKASHYGAATSRERLFLIARCDGHPIIWPKPTHGKGTRRRERSAAEIIDWSLPCASLFLDKAEAKRLRIRRPLVNGTCERIAKGVMRYVVDDPRPFIIGIDHRGSRSSVWDINRPLTTITTENRHALVCAFIAKHYGGVVGHRPDTQPLGTITTTDHHSVVACHLTKFYGTAVGAPMGEPLPTITAGAGGGHMGLVAAFLTKYYGEGSQAQSLREPLHTIPCHDRFGLVTCQVAGETHVITDIGMRMLQPHELAAAQGFDPDYHLPKVKRKAVEFIGNSVCPDVMAAIAMANAPQRARAA